MQWFHLQISELSIWIISRSEPRNDEQFCSDCGYRIFYKISCTHTFGITLALPTVSLSVFSCSLSSLILRLCYVKHEIEVGSEEESNTDSHSNNIEQQ